MEHLDTTTFILCTVPLVLLCAWAWYSNVRIAMLEAENQILKDQLQAEVERYRNLAINHSLD